MNFLLSLPTSVVDHSFFRKLQVFESPKYGISYYSHDQRHLLTLETKIHHVSAGDGTATSSVSAGIPSQA